LKGDTLSLRVITKGLPNKDINLKEQNDSKGRKSKSTIIRGLEVEKNRQNSIV